MEGKATFGNEISIEKKAGQSELDGAFSARPQPRNTAAVNGGITHPLVRSLLLLVFAVSVFMSGIVWEAISWATMIALMVGYKKTFIRQKGTKLFRLMWLYIACYVLLFCVHSLSGLEFSAINRLFGLTKCICAPALLYFTFFRDARRLPVLRKILWLVFALNICYMVAHARGQISLPLLGSENVILGINVVVFPLVYALIKKNGYSIRALNKTSLACFAALGTGILCLLVIRASTSLAVFALQLIYIALMRLNRSKHRRRIMMWFSSAAIVGIVAFVLLVANGKIPLDSMAIGTRVAIWQQALRQYAAAPLWQKILGTGDDIIQMWTKSLEAHSVVIEILMIYGAAGLAAFIAAVVAVFRRLKRKKEDVRIQLLMLISYFLTCFIHPFFTGVFPFQWLSMMAIIYGIEELNR